MQLNGSQIVMECLLEQGVDTVFGYPGGAILNIYDALYEYSDRIRHILTSHEQGASHAAPAQPIWLPVSQLRIWIRSRWLRLPRM